MTSNQEALNTLNNYFQQENDDDIHETSKTLHQNYHQKHVVIRSWVFQFSMIQL